MVARDGLRCEICGETFRDTGLPSDERAEMHNPDDPEEEGGLVHAECGLGRGWAVS